MNVDELTILLGERNLKNEGGNSPGSNAEGGGECMDDCICRALEALNNIPEAELKSLFLRVLEYVCVRRIPKDNTPYYEFYSISSKEITFHSEGVSWGLEGEVRAPRAVNGKSIAMLRRNRNMSVYVIETIEELHAWSALWRTRALVSKELAINFIADSES